MKKGGFCQFYKHLYWGNGIKKKALVKWKLHSGSGQFSVYCITKAAMEQDQLDIIHCAFLKQAYYRTNPAFIYGIASGYGEALDLVVQISQEASAAGMDGRLIEYLDSKV